jgi:hypothetical protein
MSIEIGHSARTVLPQQNYTTNSKSSCINFFLGTI